MNTSPYETSAVPLDAARLAERRDTIELACRAIGATARAVASVLDPAARLPEPERQGLAVAALWRWRVGGSAAPPGVRTLADALFDSLPREVADAMVPWPFEPWRYSPDPGPGGGLARSLLSVDRSVAYRVSGVALIGPEPGVGEPAPTGTYVGWLVPRGEEPFLVSFYRPLGARLRDLRRRLRAHRLAASDPWDEGYDDVCERVLREILLPTPSAAPSERAA